MSTVTTLDERIAKAKVTALSEGVRVSLLEATETTARYAAMSSTHPGLAYTVIIRSHEGNYECNCPAGSRGSPCKHAAAANLMFAAQLELADAKHARASSEISTEQRDKLERELAEIGL